MNRSGRVVGANTDKGLAYRDVLSPEKFASSGPGRFRRNEETLVNLGKLSVLFFGSGELMGLTAGSKEMGPAST